MPYSYSSTDKPQAYPNLTPQSFRVLPSPYPSDIGVFRIYIGALRIAHMKEHSLTGQVTLNLEDGTSRRHSSMAAALEYLFTKLEGSATQ